MGSRKATQAAYQMSRPMRTIPTTSQPINPTEMIFSKLIWCSLGVL